MVQKDSVFPLKLDLDTAVSRESPCCLTPPKQCMIWLTITNIVISDGTLYRQTIHLMLKMTTTKKL